MIKIVSCWADANEFVQTHKLKDIIRCGKFDVLKGQKKISNETFITSRCSHLGSFVLAWSRTMLFDIVQVACPNRYNEEGVNQQPLYGDTDSLVVRDWQADLLIKAGMIKKENGFLTDELAEDKSHWFAPQRLMDNMPDDIKSKSVAFQ